MPGVLWFLRVLLVLSLWFSCGLLLFFFNLAFILLVLFMCICLSHFFQIS